MRTGMNLRLPLLVIMTALTCAGCANIPPEAPQLSVELGNRVSALQDANLTLLHRFFDMKRAEVDRFVDTEWVPTFTREVFADPMISETWDTIVKENNAADRAMFFQKVCPKMQAAINNKRAELVKPLDDLERSIEQKLRDDYAQVAAINNSITSLLVSASKVEENRNRYLSMIGVTDKTVAQAIDRVDDVVDGLLGAAKEANDKVARGQQYLKELKEIGDALNGAGKEK